MIAHNLGYPRIGDRRELKKACESYWKQETGLNELRHTARRLRQYHCILQYEAGLDLVPVNDFSYYDQVLDMSLMTDAIPERFQPLAESEEFGEMDLYFAMARGYQDERHDLPAMEMTKWFDTNYHYIVPEFKKDQHFELNPAKILTEVDEALDESIPVKPVLIGPISYLLLGKEKEDGFHRLDLINKLLPVYKKLMGELFARGITWLQLDEPFLAMDLDEKTRQLYQDVYKELHNAAGNLQLLLATYFEGLRDNRQTALALPVDALHLDLIRRPQELEPVLDSLPSDMKLSLGVVDGRNVWKNDYKESLDLIRKAKERIDSERLMIAPSCSLLHVPCDLNLENEGGAIGEIREWLAFARQKINEIVDLARLAESKSINRGKDKLKQNALSVQARRQSGHVHKSSVKKRLNSIADDDLTRHKPFSGRKPVQQQKLELPLLPVTTIGSFPQTREVRKMRARRRRNEISEEDYQSFLREETRKAIEVQEEIGLDVLVHGEFERNDMVEYFGEKLKGFVFTRFGWVQSYGSRCVKPPIIYGDVERPEPMTLDWSRFAQSLTDKPVKGMLTGPVTLLQWSFVRDDQPRSATALQLALAVRDEVSDLEKSGIRVIQIDEPAFREGLPLRRADQKEYLKWAVDAFRLASSVVRDETQIHTHMCYAEFQDTLESIADMDADVISIETSRSQMELLKAFADFKYPNDIGPGVYDIHSPRVPSRNEIGELIRKATEVIPIEQLWINPDCGLKTRGWEETIPSLKNMTAAAQSMRRRFEHAPPH